jgi:hypothetical protein
MLGTSFEFGTVCTRRRGHSARDIALDILVELWPSVSPRWDRQAIRHDDLMPRAAALRHRLPVASPFHGAGPRSRNRFICSLSSDAEGGTAEAFPCLYIKPVEARALGTRDCLSAKRSPSNRSTSGPFVSGWKLQDQGGILQFSLGNQRDLEAARLGRSLPAFSK